MKNDVIKLPPDQTIKLIKLHKRFECLWNYYSPSYRKPEKKKQAWGYIAKHFNATPEQIKKKMKYLRAAYVIELNKVQKSILKNGEIYKPNLYYFRELDYVRNLVVTRKNFSNDPSLIGTRSTPRSSPTPAKIRKTQLEEATDAAAYLSDDSIPGSVSDRTNDFLTPQSNSSKIRQNNNSSANIPSISEDATEVFSRNVAHKLRNMNKIQRLIAEKIINETLFYGELELLSLPFATQFGASIENFNHMENSVKLDSDNDNDI